MIAMYLFKQKNLLLRGVRQELLPNIRIPSYCTYPGKLSVCDVVYHENVFPDFY